MWLVWVSLLIYPWKYFILDKCIFLFAKIHCLKKELCIIYDFSRIFSVIYSDAANLQNIRAFWFGASIVFVYLTNIWFLPLSCQRKSILISTIRFLHIYIAIPFHIFNCAKINISTLSKLKHLFISIMLQAIFIAILPYIHFQR